MKFYFIVRKEKMFPVYKPHAQDWNIIFMYSMFTKYEELIRIGISLEAELTCRSKIFQIWEDEI